MVQYLVYKLYNTEGTWKDLISVNGAASIPNFTIHHTPGVEGFTLDEEDGYIDLFLPNPFTWQGIIKAVEKVLGYPVAITTF